MSGKLKKIMKMKREDREIELKKYALELGVSLQGTSAKDGEIFLEAEVVNRIINAERSIREHRLWIIALISAIVSGVSALTAWFAVLRCK